MALAKASMGDNIHIQEDVAGAQSISETFDDDESLAFGIGTGAGKVSKQWNHRARVLPGASETLDLTGGVTNGRGAAVTFAKIRGFYIKNLSTTATLTLGGGTTPLNTIFGTTLVLPPNSKFSARTSDVNGWAVVASTGDQLLVTGTSGQSYTIAILGE